MLVPLLAVLRGTLLGAFSIVPYRLKSLASKRHHVFVLWYFVSLYECISARFSYDHLFSLFALAHSSLYILSISGSAIGSLLLISAMIVSPFDPLISLILFLIGYPLAMKGRYRLRREVYIVGDMLKASEIDAGKPGIVGVYPGFRRYYGELSRAFSRFFNIAYEPPNGLLIALGAIAYGIIRIILA